MIIVVPALSLCLITNMLLLIKDKDDYAQPSETK